MGKLYCQKKGCTIIANYGYKNGNCEYCFTHASKKMKNLSKRCCTFDGCNTTASYSDKLSIDSPPTHCSKHKSKDMIQRGPKCQAIGCYRRPYYNKPNHSPRYCFKHKKPNHINTNCKQCKVKGCRNYPKYGNIGSKGEYCNEHKEDNMIYLSSNLCKAPNCPLQATFGYEGKSRYCQKHASSDMISRKLYQTLLKKRKEGECLLVPLQAIVIQ